MKAKQAEGTPNRPPPLDQYVHIRTQNTLPDSDPNRPLPPP